ncbi:MAG: arsenate reductase (glutaredoxin) [Rhodospirillales bacterium]|nr:arsenate reductase (glutaredoxin) [Rhodospirillales bacterium]MDE0378191.1 arsenate reductase (glutaredoxin) [Rhodospirillales bacterium]
MAVTIYHNPRCSKSRQALQLLRERGIEPEIVEYLKTPPSADEIDVVLAKLGLEPRAVMRAKEAAYREAGMGDESLSRNALIDLMAANPIVIERPIVVNGSRAALGRPPENVLSVL